MGLFKKASANPDTAISEASPIVGRLVEHAELRSTLREAIDSAERAYERLTSKRGEKPASGDRKLKSELRTALKSLSHVSGEVGATKSKRRRCIGGRIRKALLLIAGSTVVVISCPWMRGKVLDALFGAEEEFEYSPPPMPDTSAPDAPPAASDASAPAAAADASAPPASEASGPEASDASAPADPATSEPDSTS
ncbi:MAG: hypothetical protein ACLP8S_01575 [Solirubrobacteraceae bacterium]